MAMQQGPNVLVHADADHWRRKYTDLVKTKESEERQFRALENLLRRVISRLFLATKGLSSEIDHETARWATVLHSKTLAVELEPLFLPLSDAIAALASQQPAAVVASYVESAPAALVPATIDSDAEIRRNLLALLGAVRRDTNLAPLVAEIEVQLSVPVLDGQLPQLLSDIADLVARRIMAVEAEKQEVEDLLAQITLRLDDLTEYLLGEEKEHRQSIESSKAFNQQLTTEFQDLGSSVETAADLDQVRTRVRTRLDNIDTQLQEYRSREDERAKSFADRNEEMRSRVELLEGETRNLQDRLRDEQRISMVDGLTQIPNRHACDKRMVEEFKRWQRFGQSTCIAIWDVDLFKKVNDTYGHRAGDKVLRIIAEKLNSQIRQTDFMARYGGEEFVMILAGTPPVNGLKVCDKLRESIAALGFHFKGSAVSVTVSCGVTELRPGDLLDEAFDRADKALYAAKEQGRNRCIQA
jgi:diguanylate cyclase